MSLATVVFGLLLAVVLDASGEVVLFGWLLVALGAVGVALSFLLPRVSRRR